MFFYYLLQGSDFVAHVSCLRFIKDTFHSLSKHFRTRSACHAMVYDSGLYVEKLAWDPSVYVNTPAVFGEKKTPGHPVPTASGSPAFGFALRVIVERPAKRAKYDRFVCMF